MNVQAGGGGKGEIKSKDVIQWSQIQFTSEVRNRIIFIFCLICIVLFLKLYIYDLTTEFVTSIDDGISNGKINEGLTNMTEISTVEDLPEISYSIHYRDPITGDKSSAKCNNGGLYLGVTNVYRDCSYICNSSSYTYRYFDKDSYLYHYLKTNKPGAYCVPTSISSVNSSTSTIVHGVYGWNVIPKWPRIFGGAKGTDIMCCNGRITDMMTFQHYVNDIPWNLVVQDPENETISQDLNQLSVVSRDAYLNHVDSIDNSKFEKGYFHPRFVCTDELVSSSDGNFLHIAITARKLDNNQNPLIGAPGILPRLERIRNECACQLHKAADSIMPDFNTGECSCIEGIHSTMGPANRGPTSLKSSTESDIKSEIEMANNYETLFEAGRLESSENTGIDPNRIFKQQNVCSKCPYGFVTTSDNPGSAIDKPLKKSKSLTQVDYRREYLSIPTECHSVNSPDIWTLNKNVIHKLCGFSQVNTEQQAEEDFCVSNLVDISVGGSANIKSILHEFNNHKGY